MSTIHLLAVDDEPDLEALIRQKFRRQIRDRQMEIHFARDGNEALAKLKEVPEIEVVLTDINMPGMDGLTLLAHIKELGLSCATVIVSAYGDMGNIRVAMNRGAVDFLLKPIDFTDLENTVHRTVEIVRQNRESARTQHQLFALRQELEVAAAIQRSILPLVLPPRREVQFLARMAPARQVGGDFYDVFTMADDRIGFLIADVSGKGVPAAIYMAVSRTVVTAVTQAETSISKILQMTNNLLCNYDMQCMFVTMLFGALNPISGELELCSAGHEPPYLHHKDGSLNCIKVPRNLALGVEPDFFFEPHRLQLDYGDVMLLYTDGLTEAENSQGTLYGREKLERFLCGNQGAFDSLIEDLFAQVEQHAAGTAPSDDLTILAFQFAGRPDLMGDFVEEIPYDLQRMADSLANLEAYWGNRGLDRARFLPVLLCAEEVITNAILHGGKTDPEGIPPIRFSARVKEGRVQLTLEDSGPPFNPLDVAEPDIEADADSRPIGGLGVLLTRKTMETMAYKRINNRNVLTMSRKT